MAKYYFALSIDDEMCYSLKYWQDYANEHKIKVDLVEAKIETGVEYFFCKNFSKVGIKRESDCGRSCEGYSPRNKKNGRCRYSVGCYKDTGIKNVVYPET